ncbi:MAG: HAMP domain-containing protein, partial [Moraxellaceae bacterium]|nr:HAMP domain-containing protein [Moraxellaceae bacterium]
MLKSRLFWKFFLSMMFVVLLTVFLSINFEKFVRKQQSPHIIQQTINQLVDFRDELTLALELEDFATLTKLLEEKPKYSQQILIFDEFDNEILGREQFSLPPIKHRFNHRLSKEFTEQGIELETTVISDFGQVFYLQMQPTMLYKPWLSPRIAGTFLRVTLLLIFTAIVCYLLTRMLILRINRLQQATQQLANGNYQPLISKQINSNDELGKLEKDFYQMSQQLATSQQQRKQMLSDISHELRSPLTRMQIALALVEDKFPESQPYISRAEKETQRMGELISQIIKLQKLSLYGQDKNRQQIDLI